MFRNFEKCSEILAMSQNFKNVHEIHKIIKNGFLNDFFKTLLNF